MIYSNPSILPLATSKVDRVSPTKIVSVLNPENIYKVTRIVDGDTIEVEKNNTKLPVRLIGVDTPELLTADKPAQCFAQQAADRVKQVLLDKDIYLESDPTQSDKDIYNRLLRYVILPDGTNFSKLLILEGFGHEYTFKNVPYKYQKEFLEAENIAKITKKGLWSPNACLTVSITPTITQIAEQKFSCDVKKIICSQMTNCSEAVFYLKTCGVARLDGNNDGIPCENICK
jgi:endonuclease YncB( thermonuclease family)